MVSLFFSFLFSFTFAQTLESNCQKISISSQGLKLSVVDQTHCLDKKLKEKFKDKKLNLFFAKGFGKDEYFAFHQELEDADICKFPADHISRLGKNIGSNVEVWNGQKKFAETVSNSHYTSLFNLNEKESTPDKIICSAFPFFVRANKLVPELVPRHMSQIKKGGHMVFSSFVPSIFFMSKSFDKIHYSMIFSKEVLIIDAAMRKNGYLVTITKKKSGLDDVNGKICIETWDVLSSFQIKESCKIEKFNPEQILFSSAGKLYRVYSTATEVTAEELDDEGVSGNMLTVKTNAPFSVQSAILSED